MLLYQIIGIPPICLLPWSISLQYHMVYCFQSCFSKTAPNYFHVTSGSPVYETNQYSSVFQARSAIARLQTPLWLLLLPCLSNTWSSFSCKMSLSSVFLFSINSTASWLISSRILLHSVSAPKNLFLPRWMWLRIYFCITDRWYMFVFVYIHVYPLELCISSLLCYVPKWRVHVLHWY